MLFGFWAIVHQKNMCDAMWVPVNARSFRKLQDLCKYIFMLGLLLEVMFTFSFINYKKTQMVLPLFINEYIWKNDRICQQIIRFKMNQKWRKYINWNNKNPALRTTTGQNFFCFFLSRIILMRNFEFNWRGDVTCSLLNIKDISYNPKSPYEFHCSLTYLGMLMT